MLGTNRVYRFLAQVIDRDPHTDLTGHALARIGVRARRRQNGEDTMKLTRHFFISDDLDDLEHLEEELERSGIVTPQGSARTWRSTSGVMRRRTRPG